MLGRLAAFFQEAGLGRQLRQCRVAGHRAVAVRKTGGGLLQQDHLLLLVVAARGAGSRHHGGAHQLHSLAARSTARQHCHRFAP